MEYDLIGWLTLRRDEETADIESMYEVDWIKETLISG